MEGGINPAATYREAIVVRRLSAAVLAARARRIAYGIGLMLTFGAACVHAQAPGTHRVIIDRGPEGVEEVQVAGPSLHVAVEVALDSLRRSGYYYAGLRSDVAGTVIERGRRVKLADVRLEGVDGELAQRLESLIAAPGAEYFDPRRLEQDIDRLLQALERAGRPLAHVVVARVTSTGAGRDTLSAVLRVSEGPRVQLGGVELVGDPGARSVRTSGRLAARLAELDVGDTLRTFEPERIRRRLGDAGLFDSIGEPFLAVQSDSGVVIRIPVSEGDPGTFDLVLGYLPAPDGGGRLVGNGHLQLRNVFGGGRQLAFKLDRLPNQVSRIDLRVADPYVLGMPLAVELGFRGLEQDSTFGKQTYRGELGYHLAPGMDLIGTFSREETGPGQAGLRLGPQGRQLVADASAWFLGLGARISTVDQPRNPRDGTLLEMNLESGRKQLVDRRVEGTDTVRTSTSSEQRRLHAAARYFIPVASNHVVTLGLDAGLVLSPDYDRSDLFRFGGAASLRGYDEDRFLGRIVGRVLAEYRVLIDAESYAYAFFDLGYVDRPSTPDLEAERAAHPGYGIGIQFRTLVGLLNVSAALNPDSGPTETRIHAGLSFGL